jgi:HlyD family secretion protein
MMKPNTRRNLVMLLVLGLVAAGLFWAFRPEPVTVDLQAVERGAVAVTIAEEGRTRVKEVFVVSAPIAGRLRRIELKPGDPVRADDTVLALVEPAVPPFLDARSRAQAEAEARAAEAGRDLAAAELEKARAELAFAESEMKRVSSLATNETASRRALEQASMLQRAGRAGVGTAEAALRLRQHEMEVARAKLMDPEPADAVLDRCIRVRSPVNGTVLRLLQESEAVVTAGTPLVEIGDPAAIEVVAEVLTTEAVRLSPGTEVVVERWGGADLAGRVRRVEPHGFIKVSALGVEERRVLVIVDLQAPPEAHAALGHGFRVDLRFVLARAADVPKLPVGALFRQGGGWAVFAAENGVARVRPVRIGLMDDHEAELLEGLAPGAQVIVHPSDRVEDGVAVVPRQRRG